MSHIPLPILHLMAWPLGYCLALLPNKQRHYARINVNVCFPHWPAAKRRQLWRRSLIETAKTLLEFPKIWLSPTDKTLKLVSRISHLELIQQGLERGKGVILICPHLGNWEIVGCACPFPMTIMYRTQNNASLDTIMRQGRTHSKNQLVPATQKGLGLLLKDLKENKVIGVLPDQNPGAGAGVYVPFFSILANTPIFATRLASRTGATVLNITAERLSYGRGFHLRIEPA
ncbi:MAG: hypothetical protein OEY89_10845, partial [Gammaproteobacteria bacterium]|nr:hypothetical protein [Gammaproteobacteria bacterium]